MNLDDKVFTLDDNKEYMVIADVTYEGKTYVYLENTLDQQDTLFRELVIAEDNIKLRTIDPDLFDEKIFDLFKDKITND